MKKLFTLFLDGKYISILLLSILCLISGNVFAQSYLGLEGGFEGTATLDNTVNIAAQAGKWTVNNANQTLTAETSIVRSGSNSLKATNVSTTGRRIWSPLVTASSTTSNTTIQFYRLVNNLTDTQQSQPGIGNGTTTDTFSSYAVPAAIGTWEKVTYTRASWTYTDIAGVIWIKATGAGGNIYIDDVAIYAGSLDNTAPDAPTTPSVASATATSLTVSWTAPATGIDNGGYLVVRGNADPTTAPNVNGVYAVNNAIATGMTVVYQGTGVSFVDTDLAPNTSYYYRIYTYDKAYNYSSALTANGSTVSAGINHLSANARLIQTNYFTIGGVGVATPVKGVYIEKNLYDDGTIITRKVVK